MKVFLSFEECRDFARNLNLNGKNEWFSYWKNNKRPDNIPYSAFRTYKNNGWISWGDFLGTFNVSKNDMTFLSFEECRDFARNLKLNGKDEWFSYWKNNKRPDNIPANPPIIYKDKGWITWGYFLGTFNISVNNKVFLSFEECRDFARNLNLNVKDEWFSYWKTNKKPDNIPNDPAQTLKGNGWISWGDFLGTFNVSKNDMTFLSFEECRDFARNLKLNGKDEWFSYWKTNKKPDNIPNDPAQTLKGNGWISWGDFLGTKIGYNGNFTITKKILLLNNLEHTDLLLLDPIQLQIIINNGKFPPEFCILINSDAGSDDRIKTIQELKDQFGEENSPEDIEDLTGDKKEVEITPIDDVDSEITIDSEENVEHLPTINEISDLHLYDNSLYSTMDEEAFTSLMQYSLRKLWNKVLNDEISIDFLSNEIGGKYFTMIKNMFFEEYNTILKYATPKGYNFKVDGVSKEPNLMQKLTVHRLLTNKYYGNWSGTGAGKTLSFIISSRELESKLTIVIALNSTIEQTGKAIKSVYSDSKVYTEYKKGFIFNRNNYNYLVLNYEKFQQSYSEGLFQDLTNNNKIDFVVIDEVHNAKQRDDKDESIRRGVLLRLMGRIREKNSNLYILVMSATPVINNIYEAKSLLTLLTGLNYDDISDRRTLTNAIAMFQLLSINGLRYIPKYDINIQELTGHNMTNLNIDGTSLIDDLLKTSSKSYIEVEKILLPSKLESISGSIRKGVIIYSYFTTGFINEISTFVKNLGFSVGTYTGEESTDLRKENLKKFTSGEIDVLIGSKPIGTGVDGLQETCDRMIIITLPWTDSEYTQLKGRIYRQGSKFANVDIIIPQVRIDLGNSEIWSWDVQRLNIIKHKKTLADVVVDGVIPSKILPSLDTMHKKAIDALQNWKDRVAIGNIIKNNRTKLNIELYPEIDNEDQRRQRIESELSDFNRRGKTTLSSTMHKEFTDNPDSWFRYHALRKERMERWDEIPYEYIATKIKNKKHIVVDFGCGENKMKERLSNKVISFDHVAIDDSVIACDMKDVSQYLTDESVDVTVFSLALWGTNYRDYLKESYRILNYGGFIYIAEPSKNYEGTEGLQELKTLILDAGYKLVGDIENRGKFIYIIGTKN